jgi:DNA polymerase III sliding clamp (beta) subunit (PCNA family)
MKVEIKDKFKDFKSIWEKTISKLCVENNILFTPHGMEIRFTNPSNTVMCNYRMTTDAFELYELEGEEEIININTQTFIKYLKSFKKDITLYIENNQLVLSSGKKKIRMGILTDVDSHPFRNINEFETTGFCITSTANLIESIKDNRLVSEILKLQITNDDFLISSYDGIDSSETSLECMQKDIEEDTKVLIRGDFIEQIVNPIFTEIELKFKTDSPLIFKCIQENNIKFEGVIAPSLE